METVKFLLANKENPFGAINAAYGIRVKEYPSQDTYVLNYDQIESPKSHPIVRECRSLVVNGKFEVISRSFDRFFNYGEGECEVDFSKAFAMEKADGSLISLYYNPAMNQWHFRTRGTAFAESQMPSGRSYQEAILECIGKTFAEFQESMEGTRTDLTFIFEFVSPENRIVTRYEKPQMVLLAVREKSGFYCYSQNGGNLGVMSSIFGESLGWKNVRPSRIMKVSTVAEVEKAVAELTDLQEGFVVVDSNNNRVKLKSPAYVKCHHIRGEGLTPKRIAELVAINEQDEYLAVFPEDEKFFTPYIQANQDLLYMMTVTYDHVEFIEDQKEFAVNVKDLRFSAIMFTCRKKKIPVAAAWAEAKETYKVELIEWQKNQSNQAKKADCPSLI